MTSELDSQFTTYTGARQTMSSWAHVVETFDALPVIYQEPFKRSVGNLGVFPYVVLAPAIAVLGNKRSTEKVLIKTGESLSILEHSGHAIQAVTFSVSAVDRVEYGNILIYSWITLRGVNAEGSPCASTIEFNTSSLRHILPFILCLRPAPLDSDQNTLALERSKFDYLETETYKFMSFARESLVQGERVIRAIWQPLLSRPATQLMFLPFKRKIALAHLVILTDKELILIRDDPRSKEKRGIRYGGVWEYIPISKITSISIAEKEAGIWLLSIQQLRVGPVEIYFDGAQKQDLASLQQDCEQLGISIR